MQLLPSKELIPFIRHYLFLESAGEGTKKLRLFSDGNIGMVFSKNVNLVCGNELSEPVNYLPASFVYGQISAFKDLYLINNASLVIVVFQPAGIRQMTGISAAELYDAIIPLEDLFGRKGATLHEQLAEQQNTEGKLKLLNNFFIGLAAKNNISTQLLIDESVKFIVKNKGANAVNDLVKYAGYTERHIERNFMEWIGLSPKKFSNIVRLHSFLKLLKHPSKQNNLTQLSYEAGYTDQSHLVKEFKKYTGITPKEYLHKTSLLTNNFFEFDKLQS